MVAAQPRDEAATDPLPAYDLVYTTNVWPIQNRQGLPPLTFPTARSRLTAYFSAGGGFIGAGSNAAQFINSAGQLTGLTQASRSGSGRSGIVYWSNVGGSESVVTGAYPARDTAIMDPPSWFTAVPATLTVDGRLPQSNFFAAGLWPMTGNSVTAPGSAVIAHGTNNAGNGRMTLFSMNPLYRADPEREWPMLGTSAYWIDR